MMKEFIWNPDLTAQESAEKFAEELMQKGMEGVDCYQAVTPQGEDLPEWLVIW